MAKQKNKKEKRPNIPTAVKLELWTKSGGRCSFPGCGKPLWKEGLTLSKVNLSIFAHIISWTEGGPRGDPILSPKLATDISNLMLMCLDHARLIDKKEYISEYTVEKLRRFKEEHEIRVETLLNINYHNKTHVLRFQVNIKERKTEIDVNQAYSTLIKEDKYPADEKGFAIIINDQGYGNKVWWQQQCTNIDYKVKEIYRRGNNDEGINNLSVFALAPIPLLIYLGYQLADIRTVNLYQRHRDTGDWSWKEKVDNVPEYRISKPNQVEFSNNVILILSLSDKITKQKYQHIFGTDVDVYEIYIESPHTGYLSIKKQVDDFAEHFRYLLNIIQEVYGPNKDIHLLSAIPAPIAIKAGMLLLPKKDNKLLVYEYDKENPNLFQDVIEI